MAKRNRRWRIECSEEQLRLIADCVEDITRFLAGQTELWHAASTVDHVLELQDRLEALQPLVTPELGRGAAYGWNGGDCPNDDQRRRIAMGYAVYREIVHRLTLASDRQSWSVYNSPTLTCDEGGDLPVVTMID